ncbi:PhoPQ-activated protein PqaA family protein [Haloferula chungangensis]|uniref:PhoPQ-activated protein PqaA family protein n=1 Tax=Haloferula chungangensis TaxID=1048331 RepID=A0ABW2L9C6_9BACT
MSIKLLFVTPIGFLAWLAAAFLTTSLSSRATDRTALDEFVYANDPAYNFVVTDTKSGLFHTRYIIQMTSGSWRTENEVDRTLWKHWMTVYVPSSVTKRTALLVVSGGSNEKLPDFGELDDTIGPISALTGSVIVDVGQIPNQPLTFSDETESRSEDALLAYSWKKFLDDPEDLSWPVHLPMARAVVRAMDTVQSLMSQVKPGDPIDDFIVAGASKRGWATWLTAAAENGPLGTGRVSAIIPIVIDTLNVETSFDHHFKVYGSWAPAVHDYLDAGAMDKLGTPESEALFDIVDPYSYLERLTMPKLILSSAGDQFFLPDSWKFYYDELPGKKWLRYFPNTDHSLSQLSDPLVEILPLYVALIDDGADAIPDYSWSLLPNGAIELQTSEAVSSAKLWQATNPEARDFRFEEIGAAYHSTTLSDQGGGTYIGTVTPPESGWTAYFVEIDLINGRSATSGIYLITKPEPLNLQIKHAVDEVELSFNSKRGEWYRLYSGDRPDQMSLTETIIPDGDITTWIDPAPEEERKFYQIESITP